ncbi:unnamed protein product [Clonostachys solani]|uniref:Enoyl reductase (ER) domain-containing protein n=1 Tax=Clonostachys solani TaxID=160281 RepID=A0A9N9YTG8_9HYPO|nr:unnamed protein product [Clonostachys solani]
MKALVSKSHLLSRIASLALGRQVGFSGAAYQDVPKPIISPDEILVKVRAVALNPTDFKHIDAIAWPGTIIGCDFAGEVVEVGANATGSWSVGDRVAGAVHGGLYPDRGSFAEYLKTDADLAWKIPEGVSDAEATTFGISACTAMHAINARLGLPWADEAPKHNNPAGEAVKPTIFVYAGATAAGLFTIQVAKAAGCTVVTTASPKSAGLVKSYGADAVFDYNEPLVGDTIAKQYRGITMGVDCFSEGKSFAICDAVLGSSGGTLITLLPPPKPKNTAIKHELIMSYTLFGRPFHFLAPIGPKFPAMPNDRAALARFYAKLPELLNEGTLKPLPTSVRKNGWDGILEGLDDLRGGKNRGKKLVVEL